MKTYWLNVPHSMDFDINEIGNAEWCYNYRRILAEVNDDGSYYFEDLASAFS